MKKILLILLGFGFFSCSSDIEQEPELLPKNEINVRTPEEAMAIAEQFVSAQEAPKARSTSKAARVETISPLSRSAATPMYAVNMSDDGFVIVSGSYGGESVLAYIPEGEYNAEEAHSNPGMSLFLDLAQGYVEASALDSAHIKPFDPIGMSDLLITTIPDRIEVKWGQSYPEGALCPNKVAGCGATASLMILSYLETPTGVSLTYPEADRTFQFLDWPVLKKHVASAHLPSYDCPAGEEAHMALARLAREIGYKANANYHEDRSTGMQADDVIEVLKGWIGPQVNVTEFLYNQHTSQLYDVLNNSNSVFFAGYDVTTKDKHMGHGWVCDGAKRVDLITYITEIGGNKTYTIDKSTFYYHMNWGWIGSYNGYYLSDAFEVKDGNGRLLYNFDTYLRFWSFTK